uniref:Uncharacterized protein n=1 Tax=Rhizophora mucronata TaxID=61149 RepID=A0A2P2N672_RHIMU
MHLVDQGLTSSCPYLVQSFKESQDARKPGSVKNGFPFLFVP